MKWCQLPLHVSVKTFLKKLKIEWNVSKTSNNVTGNGIREIGEMPVVFVW